MLKCRRALKRNWLMVALLIPTLLMANGLNLNNAGTKAIGMGGAFTGIADDYSAVYYNPAGLTQLEGTSFSFFFTDVIPNNTYKADIYGVDASSKSHHYISGALAAFFDVGEKFKVGLFANVPAGLGVEWDGADLRNLTGGNPDFEWYSQIAVIHFGPAIAYQVSDKFSIGATVNIAYGMMDLRRPVDMTQDHVPETQYKEESTGLGYGVNIGALYHFNEKLSLGATFKSEVNVAYDGTAKNPTLPLIAGQLGLVGVSGESDFERDITWPMMVHAGLGYKATDKLTLAADVHWFQWSANQDVIGTSYDDAVWKNILEPAGAHQLHLKWEDQIQIRLGGEYQLNDMIALRAGYYHDPAPAPDETANILLPSITYNAITLGVGVRKGLLGFEVGLEILTGDERDIKPQTADNNLGLHKTNILTPNFALTYFLN